MFLDRGGRIWYNKASKGKGEKVMKKKIGCRAFAAAMTVCLAIAVSPALSVAAADGVTEAPQVRATYVSNYESRAAIPQGAYQVNVNINGRRVLQGRVFNYNKITYVPMFAYADWLGVFQYSQSGNYATITGTNLKITARAGDLYISANDRFFYTGEPVLNYNGVIYVPILPMTKALNCHVAYNSSIGAFEVRSGDSRRLAHGSQVYAEDAVYWLSRIISAEAKGEPMEGKIAVGNVVLNRVRSSAFPNTIYGVIFDKKYGIQFSPVANGTIYASPTAESVIAAKICLEGYSLSDDALYFVNLHIAPNSWISQNRPYLFTIGNHTFYK